MCKIKTEKLCFSYGKYQALQNINLEMPKSELICLIGPNGSGKSTLLKCLAGLISVRANTVLINGRDIKKYRIKELARDIAYVPQISGQVTGFSVREVIMMGRYPYENIRDNEIAVDEAIELAGLGEIENKDCSQLSGGEYQRTMIARAIAQQTSIILLDEPVSHLDVRYQIEIMQTLKRLSSEKGTLVLSSIHDLNFASIYADKIILLDQGRLFDAGVPQNIMNACNINRVYQTKMSSFSPDGNISLFYPSGSVVI